MFLSTLRRLRQERRRLIAAGTAVVLGTAFVTAVLLGGTLLQRTAYQTVSASFAGADVVVTVAAPGSGPAPPGVGDDALLAVRRLPGAAGVDGRLRQLVELASGPRVRPVLVTNMPSVPALQPDLVSGSLPTSPGDLVLYEAVAGRLGVDVGSPVRVLITSLPTDDAPVPVREDVAGLVVGLVAGEVNPVTDTADVLAGGDDVLAWSRLPTEGLYSSLLVVAAPGTSPEQLREEVETALQPHAAGGLELTVRTADDEASLTVDALAGGDDVLTSIGLAFGALALFVAGLVIANTFSVLVAQRTRQLALLRCVGATRVQVLGSVLLEASVLGLVASAVGVAAGTGLLAAATAVLRSIDVLEVGPVVLVPTAQSVLLPVLLGTVVTLVAAVVPAREATRVGPLAAMRPAVAPAFDTSRTRVALAMGMFVGGTALVAGGVWLAGTGADGGLLLAVPGAALSFAGVLVGAVLVVPVVIGVVGRAVAAATGSGVTRLAAVNAVRDPRRTASTASSLLIGVTLVTTVLVGAATTSASITTALDRASPLDVVVGRSPQPPQPHGLDGGNSGAGSGVRAPALPPGLVAGVAGVDGVTAAVGVRSVSTIVGAADVTVVGVDAAQARSVVADPVVLAPLRPGAAVVSAAVAQDLDLQDGAELVLSAGGPSRSLRVVVTGFDHNAVLVSGTDLDAIAPGAPFTQVWAALEGGADPVLISTEVTDLVDASTEGTELEGAVPVMGEAIERAGRQQIIDTLLLVVLALLGIAVVTAVVGVTNTLSLSVLERSRESAVLRVLGLTRAQLHSMLAVEGVLLASSAVVLGLPLGALYGWAGAASLLGNLGGEPVHPAIPAGGAAVVAAATLAAGLLASVLPGFWAARTSPASALAEQ